MRRKSLFLAALACGTVFGIGGCIESLLFFVAPFLT